MSNTSKIEFTISDTIRCQELLKSSSNGKSYEKTFEAILQKKSLLKKLFKVSKECVFSIKNRLSKELDNLPDHGKGKKFWLHWFFKITINCKRNTITGVLQGAKMISIDYNLEILRITNRILLAGFSKKFMNGTS